MYFKRSVDCWIAGCWQPESHLFMSQLAGCGELKMESTFIRPSPLFETTAGYWGCFSWQFLCEHLSSSLLKTECLKKCLPYYKYLRNIAPCLETWHLQTFEVQFLLCFECATGLFIKLWARKQILFFKMSINGYSFHQTVHLLEWWIKHEHVL